MNEYERKSPRIVRTPVKPIKVEGDPRPNVKPGVRLMVCIDCQRLDHPLYGSKIELVWRDLETNIELSQYLAVPAGSIQRRTNNKALRNYCLALSLHPNKVDELDFNKLIGVKARVQVETTTPKYNRGTLKGNVQPSGSFIPRLRRS